MISENEDAVGYCQSRGLRILAVKAFQFFSHHLSQIKGNYLEIGVFEGFMLRELAKQYPDKMFYGIDPFIEDGHTTGHNGGVQKGEITHEQRRIAHENIDGVANIHLFEQTSRSFFNNRTRNELYRMRVKAVFIDGDHSYEEAKNDMLNCLRFRPKVIYIDDYGLEPVGRAADEFNLAQITFFK